MLAGFFPEAAQSQNLFKAHLSGVHEVPLVHNRGQGEVTLTVANSTITVTGSFEGLDSPVDTDIGMHIHLGFAGQNGGVLLALNPSLDMDGRGGDLLAADNTFPVSSGFLDTLRRRQMYVNLHTVDHPNGAIRGQLLGDADLYYSAKLHGSNQVPPVETSASGEVMMEIDTNSNEMRVSGAFINLDSDLNTNIGGGAHIHTGFPGENGGVVQALRPSTGNDATSGVFELSNNTFSVQATDWARIDSGGYYVNIHSIDFPSGAIRGQVLPPSRAIYRTFLAGSQEAPPVEGGGRGQVHAWLQGDTLYMAGSFATDTDIDPNIGAHIHAGYAGQNGPVIQPLSLSFDGSTRNAGLLFPQDNAYELSNGAIDTLFDRGYYLNFHTTAFASGAIRGQILPQSEQYYYAIATGGQVVPATQTDAFGAFVMEVRGALGIVSGTVEGLDSSLTGDPELRQGLAGEAFGDIQLTTLDIVPDGNGFLLPADSNRVFLLGNNAIRPETRTVFISVPTNKSLSGVELRAQFLGEAERYYQADLSGNQSVPAVNTGGRGRLMFERTGDELLVSGTFADLNSNIDENIGGGAHLHAGMAGENGPIEMGLQLQAPSSSGFLVADSNTFTLGDSSITRLDRRSLYANFHTEDEPSGEIRGQVLPLAQNYYHARLSSLVEVPPIMTEGQGGLALEYLDGSLVVSGAFDELSAPFARNIGAHLHTDSVGGNGPVDIPLSLLLDGDQLGGQFPADSNRYTLNSSQRTRLNGQGYYANIHTDAFNSGEIRGQVLDAIHFFPTSVQASVNIDSIDIRTNPSDTIQLSWTPAQDTDPLGYIVQIYTGSTLDTLVWMESTRDTSLSVIAVELSNSVVEILGSGDPIELDLAYRVLSTDGSLVAAGAVDSFFATTFGVVQNIAEKELSAIDWSVYPNPAHDQAWIEVRTPSATDAVLEIWDVQGRRLRHVSLVLPQGSNRHTVPIDALSPGVYMIHVRTEKGHGRMKRLMVR